MRAPLWKLWFSRLPQDYWPLTWTSLWLEWRIWGDRAWGYHATNVALHLAAALLLWRTLRRIGVPGAWLAGLLFAIHPVAVDSAAWISERKNTLSGVLFLGSIHAWIGFDEEGRRRDFWAALLLFLLALLAKTSVVMLPVVLLGIALYRRGAVRRADVIRALPFFALSLALGSITAWFQWSRAMGQTVLPERGVAERVGGAAWALASYLKTAFLPVGLSSVYPDWPFAPTSPLFFVPLLLLAAASVLLWRHRRSAARAVLFAAGYHAVMLLPVLGFVNMAYFAIAPVSNHLQYLALMGPCALVAAGLTRAASGRWRVAARVTAVAVAAFLGVATLRRAAAFENDLTFWQAAARDAPQSLIAVWAYSDHLADTGRKAQALHELAAAAERARDEAFRRRARSLWLLQSGFYAEALAEAQTADRLRPNAELQAEIGRLLTRAGRPLEAIEVLAPLVSRAPRNIDFRYWFAAALTRANRLAEAAEVLRTSCALAPEDARSHQALSLVLVRLGLVEEAREHLAVTLGLDPHHASVEAQLSQLVSEARAPVRQAP